MSSNSSTDYAPLHDKDMRSVDGLDMLSMHMNSSSPKRRRLVRVFKFLSCLVLLGFIVLTFALSFHAVDLLGKIVHLIKESNKPGPPTHQRSYKYPCGTTAGQAHVKGCIFDVMSMAWQSPECHDPDLADEFASHGPFPFYASSAADRLLTLDDVSREGQISWTTRRYLVQHCIFGWKAMHRAWQRGWRMDANLASIEHTELCARVFANTSVPLDAITTRVHVDFPSCN